MRAPRLLWQISNNGNMAVIQHAELLASSRAVLKSRSAQSAGPGRKVLNGRGNRVDELMG